MESGIPQDVQQAFRDTGTAHVIAISGFNISILGGLFAVLFLRLLGNRRRFLAVGLSLLAIGCYTLLVGAGASVVRAAIMGVLGLFAVQLGRRQDGFNSLAFAAALMALISPFVLWDVSFQLSFMATLGLVLYADLLMAGIARLAERWLPSAAALRLPAESAQRVAKPAGEYLLFTLAALLTTLPVIVYHFQRLSLSALVANPLILPVQPAVMVLGGLAVVLGMIYQPLGQAVAALAWPFTSYTIRVVEWMAQIPGGVYLTGPVGLVWVFLYYGVLLGVTFAGGRLRGAAGLVKPGVLLAALAALAVVAWQGVMSAPDGRLHLAVLDVGGGEALLVTTPGGRTVLINGGSSPSRLSDALGRRLPLTRRRLDWLVVASPGNEQIAALPRALERFPPGEVLWAGAGDDSSAVRSLRNYFNERGIIPAAAQPGQVLDLGDGAALRVVAAGESGAVLLLEWGSFRALLPLGMDEGVLADLLDDPTFGPVTSLLLADGGSAALNPPEWVEKLRPGVLLLSAGGGNQPDPEVMAAQEGYTLLRTDHNGWIHLRTDGEQMWVEVERK